jgi:hypothetical protein
MQCIQKHFPPLLVASRPTISHICDKEGKLTPHHIRFPSERRVWDLTQLKPEQTLEIGAPKKKKKKKKKKKGNDPVSSSRPLYT